MDIYHAGEVKDGRVILDDPQIFKTKVKLLEGKRIQLLLRKYKTSRSGKQNRYYWGVAIAMIEDYTGDDKDSIHEEMRLKFLKTINKRGKETLRSTTSLTTTEFEVYLEKVKGYASQEFGIYIPDPNEVEIDS